MELQNKRLSNDEFYGIQKEILNQWPTGADVNFEEAVEFHKSLPEHKNGRNITQEEIAESYIEFFGLEEKFDREWAERNTQEEKPDMFGWVNEALAGLTIRRA